MRYLVIDHGMTPVGCSFLIHLKEEKLSSFLQFKNEDGCHAMLYDCT